ncbi:DNA circularization N-terminal domain-containing protein [Bradyrhizobium tropiciagri]|uniref:DNA circularization N-terminal domain-containing protein n=1 Tax=Bradyrhizobium tropiciagri TaxID=312253 RepID=UPI001BA75E31|nr:DNA circularization N-terminal domain-containing protein [Bradyrhizobium tropiciagri]MBR0871204.1 DNA circularization N-terminal domain-containing protein [Bradyrhizobium tropiciagri]
MSRNWLKTLWSASYKGTPFFVERDEEEGGRRIVVHQFPMRDDPYLEDLGEDKREFQVVAYVASDAADTQAAALAASCASRGPGNLVLPTHGPIIVRCLSFQRQRDKDKHGYIAFRLDFVREGSAFALATVAALANLIFAAADNLSFVAATAFASSLTFANQPDYVRDAAVTAVETNAAALESIRSSATVDPAVSLAQKVEIQSIFDAASDVITTPVVGARAYATPAGLAANSPAVDLGARIMASARAIGDGIPPAEAVSTFENLLASAQVEVPAPIFSTPGTIAEASNEATAYRALRVAALAVYGEAIARVTLSDRPAALTLRADVAELFESELLALDAGDTDLAHALMQMRDAVIKYLSRAVLDLASVLIIEANLSMPSLFWAWKLYQDPTRSTELAARNRVPHPSFMPNDFEALAK